MSMTSSKQVFAEAQANHEGDRAALLAAINSAANELSRKSDAQSTRSKTSKALMKGSNVNAAVARDLVSNASSRVADLRDFQEAIGEAVPKQTPEQFEHGKTLLNQRAEVDERGKQAEEDLRSLRSEFDYGQKRKFVDVLGNVSATAKLNRLRALEAAKNGKAPSEIGISTMSFKSFVSKQSANSKLSKQSLAALRMRNALAKQKDAKAEVGESKSVKGEEAEVIPESVDGESDVLEAKPEDFYLCRICPKALTEDEKIINARFVNEAMAASQDISVFPICITCNFDNLISTARQAKDKERKYTTMKQSKGVFFPSNKKLFDNSMHMNSEEFKQLGTLHNENRAADYYPLDNPQPTDFAINPARAAEMEKLMQKDKHKRDRRSLSLADKADMARGADDPDKSRTQHVKAMMAERMQEEELRQRIVAEEVVKMKLNGPRASSAVRRRNELLFPTTTSQEMLNQDVHTTRNIDKTNFKKKNPFSAYVNSMFNQGVFVNPWQDMC